MFIVPGTVEQVGLLMRRVSPANYNHLTSGYDVNLELVAVWSPPAFTGGRIIQYHVNFTSQVSHVYHMQFITYSRDISVPKVLSLE